MADTAGGNDASPDTSIRMSRKGLGFLLVFLLGSLLVIGTITASLWSTSLPEGSTTSWVAAPGTTPGPGPFLERIEPDSMTFGIGKPVVRLRGRNFTNVSRVNFDGAAHGGARFVDARHLVVELRESDFRYAGPIAITVTVDDRTSNVGELVILPGSRFMLSWDLPFLDPFPISVESRTLMLVLVVGAFGGTLASLNSLANYRGDGALTRSWFLYYLLAPVLGGGMAGLLYAGVRAGLLAGTDVKMDASSTPWGLIAVAGLAGLFYDKTFVKLREIYVTLFNPKDERGGKLSQSAPARKLVILTKSIPLPKAGRNYRFQMEAAGGAPPLSWSVDRPLPGGFVLDPMTGVISGVSGEEVGSTEFTFEVRDMNKIKTSVTLKFGVTS